MPATGVTNFFEELDQEESALEVHRTKAEILIVSAECLIVQVNVKQLASFPSLGDCVREIQTAICSCATSGLTPTISGRSNVAIKPSIAPVVAK